MALPSPRLGRGREKMPGAGIACAGLFWGLGILKEAEGRGHTRSTRPSFRGLGVGWGSPSRRQPRRTWRTA